MDFKETTPTVRLDVDADNSPTLWHGGVQVFPALDGGGDGGGGGGTPPASGDFATALQAACDGGHMLHWYSDVETSVPIVATITKHTAGPFGLDMHGHKIRSRIGDGGDVLTFRIVEGGIDCRYLRVHDAGIFGSGNDGHGLVISCPRNDSWIYN